MLLSADMLELGDAGVVMIVGIADHADRLIAFLCQIAVYALQAAVRQFSVAVIEIGIDGAGKEDVFRLYFCFNPKKSALF